MYIFGRECQPEPRQLGDKLAWGVALCDFELGADAMLNFVRIIPASDIAQMNLSFAILRHNEHMLRHRLRLTHISSVVLLWRQPAAAGNEMGFAYSERRLSYNIQFRGRYSIGILKIWIIRPAGP